MFNTGTNGFKGGSDSLSFAGNIEIEAGWPYAKECCNCGILHWAVGWTRWSPWLLPSFTFYGSIFCLALRRSYQFQYSDIYQGRKINVPHIWRRISDSPFNRFVKHSSLNICWGNGKKERFFPQRRECPRKALFHQTWQAARRYLSSSPNVFCHSAGK